jgi:hypothetical protein
VSVLEGLETRLKAFVEDAVREAEASAPAIDAAIYSAMTAAGVPPAWAQNAADQVKMAIDHFASDHAPAQPEPAPELAPEPQPDPGVPGA